MAGLRTVMPLLFAALAGITAAAQQRVSHGRVFPPEELGSLAPPDRDEWQKPDKIMVRTYERGVENETYSCGTGVTAAALVCYHNDNGFNEVEVKTLGGTLSVEYERVNNGQFINIWLSGPAEKVFEGSVDLK